MMVKTPKSKSLSDALDRYIKLRVEQGLRAKGAEIRRLKQRVDNFDKDLTNVEKKVGIR